jgi:hypothetical protein
LKQAQTQWVLIVNKAKSIRKFLSLVVTVGTPDSDSSGVFNILCVLGRTDLQPVHCVQVVNRRAPIGWYKDQNTV